MTRAACITTLVGLLASSANGQPPAGRKVDLATGLQVSYAGIKSNLVAEADKMPEADYGFKPGSMPEVRTFGQLFAHVAAGHFGTCAAVKGVPNPVQGRNLEQELKTKAELIKTLGDSFTFCDDAFSSTTAENATAFIRQGPNEITRATALYGLLAHDAEMYGIGTVYLRLKGIVPPSTERQNTGRGRGAVLQDPPSASTPSTASVEVETFVREALRDRLVAGDIPDLHLVRRTKGTQVMVRAELPQSRLRITSRALPAIADTELVLVTSAEAKQAASRTGQLQHVIAVDHVQIEGSRATLWLGVALEVPPGMVSMCCCEREAQFSKRDSGWVFERWGTNGRCY